MSEQGLVDWGLASRVAGVVHGEPSRPLTTEAEAATAFATALDRVLAYSALEPASPPPPVELVGRGEWAQSNLSMLRRLAGPLEQRALEEIGLPGFAGGFARRALGTAAGAEAGVVVGYAARRVIGQYAVELSADPAPARMLLVGANVDHAARELGVDRQRFLLWVAIHEQTHGVQFASVPWLHGHVSSLVAELIDGADARVDIGELISRARRTIAGDPRKVLGRALRGELIRALAGPGQTELLDRIQAAMTVVEGHAEHVMDGACAPEDELGDLRGRMDARRARRGGLAAVIARVFGLDAKLSQYETGKAWADAVVAEHGIEGLNQVWAAPRALPTPGELAEPLAWSRRVLALAR